MTQGNLPRYYRVSRTGRARWEPTKAMRALGYKTEQLGPDGIAARARAEHVNAQWDVTRKGHKASDEAIFAAGYAGNQVDRARAEAVLDNIFVWTVPLANSPAAAYLAKGMRRMAGELERHAKSAATNATRRDFLRVAS
jgi:hypothetical protein